MKFLKPNLIIFHLIEKSYFLPDEQFLYILNHFVSLKSCDVTEY